jgi:lysophospholipase L1-like esterase
MDFRMTFLCAGMLAGAFPAKAVVDVAADNPGIQYIGRFDFADPKKPRCDWPGSSIQARFTGTTITVKISGGTNDFNVIIDGQWKSKLTVDGKTSQVAAAGLAEGTHTLLLTKRTEGFNGISVFEGFQLPDGQALAPPPARPSPRIQFIGDSFTAGYGDEATVTNCPDRRPYDNNYVAYGPVAARALGADYSVQAVSGLGMVHNYGDAQPLSANPMPPYYERTLFNAASPKWDFSKWVPDVVTVALGTNDFSTAVKPTQTQYSGAYKAFLAKLRAWHPDAHLVCVTYAVDAFQEKFVDALVKETAASDAKVHHVKLPGLTSAEMGCDGHPNVAGQKKYADILIPELRKYLPTTGLARPVAPRTGSFRIPKGGWETWRVPYAALGEGRVDARGRLIGF